MENNKYILANIKIPMKINSDGTYETLPNYLTIIFENINELPSKMENDYNNEHIKKQIISLLNRKGSDDVLLEEKDKEEEKEEKKETKLVVSIDDINKRKHRPHKKNLTFKNNPTHITRYTAKNYSV
jgi:hypothetical protein